MIYYDEQNRQFTLQTTNSSYVFMGDSNLKSLYWGGPVSPEDCTFLNQSIYYSPYDLDISMEKREFPVADGQNFLEPCLQAHSNGIRAGQFVFDSYQIEEGIEFQRLKISLKETNLHLELDLIYDVYEKHDVISRKAVLKNEGENSVYVRRMFSGALHPPKRDKLIFRYLSGKWAAENQISDQELKQGNFTIQSKFGTTGHCFNPAFAIHENATEETGEVWFGLLAYSGSWKISVEKTAFGTVTVLGGRNDFDAGFTLEPGTQLKSPKFLCGYTDQGFGGMSRKLHSLEKKYFSITSQPRRIIYNSWEATTFNVNAENQKRLAQKASALGIELFVMDDGWFGQRNSDCAGLGDWYVNREKFPNGLEELINYVNELGMDFGLWVEPESVNPDSELFRAHPDWVYRQEGVAPITMRNQYTLNLSLPQVKEYIKSFLSNLLKTYRITFLKWDMNRYYTDLGCITDQSAGHVAGLYEIWDWLRREFPNVELEDCSGGGGRCDLGMLSRAHQCWTSDNTDPFERLFIQEGYSYFYPPNMMMCWVTDTAKSLNRIGRCRIAYQFHSAMCGGLGIGTNISELSAEEIKEYRRFISLYKEVRPVIQNGSLYRLLSPREGNISAVQYNAQDQSEAVIFAFLHSQTFVGILPFEGTRSPNEYLLRLKGLEPSAIYEINGEKRLSGKTLMNLGLPLYLANDFDSAMYRLKKIK